MNSDVKICGFKEKDAIDIVRLHKENSVYFEEMDVTQEFIVNLSRRCDFKLFVASLNNRLVGFMGVLYHPGVGRGEIGPIGASMIFRNHGIGTKLLNCGISFLKQNHIKRVIVRVKSDNEVGLKFFLKHGFTKEAYFGNYTLAGEEVIQLVRFI